MKAMKNLVMPLVIVMAGVCIGGCGKSDMQPAASTHSAESTPKEAHVGDNSGLAEAITKAAGGGKTAEVRALLAQGADVNARDNEQRTPLHRTCRLGGHLETAKLLVENGADVDARDDDQFTPLFNAARYGHTELVQLLVAHEADIDARSKAGETPLMQAAFHGHLEAARALIESGADVNAKSKSIRTPLNAAARKGHAAVVRLLLDAGADPTVKDGMRFETARQMAENKGHTEVLEVLDAHGQHEQGEKATKQ